MSSKVWILPTQLMRQSTTLAVIVMQGWVIWLLSRWGSFGEFEGNQKRDRNRARETNTLQSGNLSKKYSSSLSHILVIYCLYIGQILVKYWSHIDLTHQRRTWGGPSSLEKIGSWAKLWLQWQMTLDKSSVWWKGKVGAVMQLCSNYAADRNAAVFSTQAHQPNHLHQMIKSEIALEILLKIVLDIVQGVFFHCLFNSTLKSTEKLI